VRTELAVAIARTGKRKGEIARRAGLRADKLSCLLSGRMNPRADEARRLARVLGVTAAQLGL
jgi:hypothetical protein